MDVAKCGWLIIFQPWVFTACIESYICTWDSRQEVPFTSSYTFASFLAKATEVREWILGTKVMNHSGRMHAEMCFPQALLSLKCARVDWWEQRNLQKLPADDFSTENGVPLRMFDHSRSMFCSVLSVHPEASGACHQEQTLPTDDRPAEPGQCLGQEDGGKSTTQGLRSELQGAESVFFFDGRLPIATTCRVFPMMFPKLCCLPNAWWGYHEIIGTCYWVRSSGPSGECWRRTFAKLLQRETYAKEDACSHCIDGDMLHNQELDPSLEPILAKNIIDNGGGTLSLKVHNCTSDWINTKIDMLCWFFLDLV